MQGSRTAGRIGLESSEVGSNSTVVTFQTRTYETDGDVQSDTTLANTVTYAHDDQARLTEVCVGTCAPDAPSTEYLYDEAGNRVEESSPIRCVASTASWPMTWCRR